MKSVMERKAKLVFILLMTLSFKWASAQDLNTGVSYGFKQDTVTVKAGETFSNALWVNNHSALPVKLVPLNLRDKALNGLLRLPDTLSLQPGERKVFPLKYMADRVTISKNFQDLPIQLWELTGRVPINKQAVFYVQLLNVQGLFIDTDQQEVYLNQLTNQARVMIRCFNNGFIPLSFRIELTEIPDGLDFVGETTELHIQPGAQLSLPFIAKNKLNSKFPADFTVTIRAIDLRGQQMAIKRIRIMSLTSDRRLGLNRTPFDQSRPNTIALRYMSVDQSLSAYQFQGNGKYTLKQGELRYQLNTDYFANPGEKVFNVYDTYVDYTGKKWGLKLGNIYESLDFNVNGRGIKGTAQLTEKRSVDVYALDNNYLLYSDFNRLKAGSTFAVVYNEGKEATNHKRLILLRNNNLWTRINSTLLSTAINVPINARHQLGFEGGYSDISSGLGLNERRDGAAVGFNYSLNTDKLNFVSNNYYSSGYYAGLRRGLLQLDNKVLLRLGVAKSVSARVTLVNNKPKSLWYTNGSYLPITNNYGQNVYELGFNQRTGRWGISVAPYYFSQHMDANHPDAANAGVVRWKSSSLRTKLNFTYSNAYHEFSLEADQGYTFTNTSGRPPAPFLSSRTNFNYRNQVAGFTAFSQFNSYYLTDALGVSQNPKYAIYSLGPNAHFALFEGSLTVNANAMYNYYGFNNSQNYSFNSNLRWMLPQNWALSLDFFYGLNQRRNSRAYNPITGIEGQESWNDPNDNFRFDNRQLRIGVEKSFGRNAQDDHMKLEMTFFEDENGNGLRDHSEPLVPGLLVKIEGLAAVTNAKGQVRFTAYKNRNYQISIINDKGLSLLRPVEIFLNKHQKISVPLVKMERLSGNLSYVAEKYQEGKPKLAGIRVKAIGDGGMVFHTLTDDDGSFNFFLPENKYTVSVLTEGLPFSISNQQEVVEVKKNLTCRLVFDYKETQRKVEVMKFK